MVLFANISPAATTRYTLRLGERKEEQKSSGIWISTAAGSTAAISAAGGTVFPILDERCQFFIRELYSPPDNEGELLRKGIFNPDNDRLAIENHCEKAMLATDGQHGFIRLEFGDRIHFKKGPKLKLCSNLT